MTADNRQDIHQDEFESNASYHCRTFFCDLIRQTGMVFVSFDIAMMRMIGIEKNAPNINPKSREGSIAESDIGQPI